MYFCARRDKELFDHVCVRVSVVCVCACMSVSRHSLMTSWQDMIRKDLNIERRRTNGIRMQQHISQVEDSHSK